MKVLFWMNTGFDSHTTSEHLLNAVIEQLCVAGNNVHVIQKIPRGTKPVLPREIVDLCVTTDGVEIKTPNKVNFAGRYFNAVKYYWKCRHLLKKHNDSDVVFLQSTNEAGFAVWLMKRYIKKAHITFNVQDIFPYNAVFSGTLKKNGILFKALDAVQQYAYKQSDHIITISEDMKDTLVSAGVTENKIEVIYNWSYKDEPYENLDLSPVSFMFDRNFFNIVYAGNIGVMQNVDILIEAARLMEDDQSVWFHIIGNGVYKEKLESRAKEYGISNISFWPMQPPENAPLIYSSADVNVIPLVENVYRTALPSKTATCLACKKPLIFAIGKGSKFGLRMENEVGCPVVSSDDAEELVSKIREIQQGHIVFGDNQFFLKCLSKTKNSRMYAEIITDKAEI